MSRPSLDRVLAYVTVVGLAVGGYLYLEGLYSGIDSLYEEAEARRAEEILLDEGWKERDGQVFDRLLSLLERHWVQTEQRFEELENEHKMLMQEIADLNYRIGLHQGEHSGK